MNKKWTTEAIIAEARKYATPTEWLKENSSSYYAARRDNLLKEATAHMTRRNIRDPWTIETIFAEAKKFSNRRDWLKASESCYRAAIRFGILEQASAHMEILTHQRKWTPEAIAAEAKKYTKIAEWLEASKSSYDAAIKLGILKEVSAHIVRGRPRPYTKKSPPCSKWTKETILAEAKKYTTPTEWLKGSPRSYYPAQRMGLLEEATAHMTRREIRKPWTIDEIMTEASKYNTASKWKNESKASYNAAMRKGILDLCTMHMYSDGRGKRNRK